jgi:AraC family transcriptional regulator
MRPAAGGIFESDAMAQRSTVTEVATVVVDAELQCPAMTAQLVRYDIPAPAQAVLADDEAYQINMCLTPRPLDARAGYVERWGPQRLDRLGDIFLIPPGEKLLVKGGSVRQSSLLCFLNPDAIHTIVGRKLVWTEKQLASTVDITNARVRALLYRLAEEVRHPALASDRMFEFLSGELAIELARFCLERVEQPVTGGLAGWRLRLIDERLSDDMQAPSLSELAKLCNISVRQLTRGFRVSRGCSIGDYVEQRRMETAKRLLMAGESVKAVAFKLGFSSPSSFTFAFRRSVGSSPSQFRRRQGRGLEVRLGEAPEMA